MKRSGNETRIRKESTMSSNSEIEERQRDLRADMSKVQYNVKCVLQTLLPAMHSRLTHLEKELRGREEAQKQRPLKTEAEVLLEHENRL